MLLLLYIGVFFTNNIYPNSSPLKTNKRKQKTWISNIGSPNEPHWLMAHRGIFKRNKQRLQS